MDSDDMMTTEQAAKFLGCSTPTLKRWRGEGSGPPYTKRSARHLRYSRSELAAWLITKHVVPCAAGKAG